METISLPPSVEEIARKAEAGAVEVARGAVTWAYGVVTDLVDEVKRSMPTPSECDATREQFLTVEEASEFLRVKTSTIYSWVS